MLSSTFHEHAILKLAPVLHSFSSSTATAEYADPHFPFHVLYIYIYIYMITGVQASGVINSCDY